VVVKHGMINSVEKSIYDLVPRTAHEVIRRFKFIAALAASLRVHNARKIPDHRPFS
jgi:hypothetical protein